MKWTLRVAQVAGINIRVHATFALIVAFGAMHWGAGNGVAGALFGVLATLLLFVGVALHELGHSFAARWFGLPVREIILSPIGGVALLEGRPARPWHELVIALAGPAVNVVIAALLFAPAMLLLATSPDPVSLAALSQPSLTTLVVWLLLSNVMLAVFNMIPALPMDGGRVLRSVLAMVVPAERATRIASVVGQVLAVAMGLWAVLAGSILLGVIAVIVFFAAAQERRSEGVRSVLQGIPAGVLGRGWPTAAGPAWSVRDTLVVLMETQQHELPVVRDGRLVGVVTRERAVEAARQGWADQPVLGIVDDRVVHVDASMSVDDVLVVMSRAGANAAAVHEDGVLVGLITPYRVNQAVEIAAAMQLGRPVLRPDVDARASSQTP